MAKRNLLYTAMIATMILSPFTPTAAQSEIDLSPASRIALGVETAPVMEARASEITRATGVVIPPNGASRTAVSPFGGVIVNAMATPGTKVKTGAPLAVLYSADYADAEAELESRRLTMAHMAHLAARADELFELGLRSEQEADEAHHDAMSARLAYEAMHDRLKYIQKGEHPGQFVLTAPADGVVTHIYPGDGDMIEAGGPVASILMGETYWARVQLPERHATLLKPGDTAMIDRLSASATIVSVDPEIDPKTRSLDVLVALPSGPEWRLGAMVALSFDAAQPEGALLAPSRAIVKIDGEDVVFVETESGFRMTPVEIVARARDEALLRGDLAPGDKVATSGLAALKNIAGEV